LINNVKNAFDKAANDYDLSRKQIIPFMDIYYNTAVELTRQYENPTILDLGAGTGILTQLLHEVHPESSITLVDMSHEMLSKARSKFASIDKFEYIEDNYLTMEFPSSYDIIISSLSIHHLTDKQKQILYKKIYDHLNNDGVFINADEVHGPTDKTEQMYKELENEHLYNQDISNQKKSEILERRKLDQPATLLDTISWYEEIGYKNVDIFYKYYRYFVIYGEK